LRLETLNHAVSELARIAREARAAAQVRGRAEYDPDDICDDVDTPPRPRANKAVALATQAQIAERENAYRQLPYSERPPFKMWMRPISGADWGDEPDEELSVISIDDLLRAETSSEFGTGLDTDELRLLVQWEAMLELHQWACLYCGRRSEVLQMDHVVPRARGGFDSMDNIVPACPHCNVSKGAKSLGAWLDARPDLDRRAIAARWERTGRGGTLLGVTKAGG